MCGQSMSTAGVACRQRQQRNENVGGGKVYGEYNKGPVKAGGEYNWDEQVGISDPRPWKSNKGYHWDEKEANVGGGRVYGEYNEGPYKAGAEYNWDEEEANVGKGGCHRTLLGRC